VIIFNNICSEIPYKIFKEKYEEGIAAGQNNIEAFSISSFSKELNEVNSRYVNLKFINNKEFIFFSNYHSPKSYEFLSHKQITALFYWNNINLQIRLKAYIKKADKVFNSNYFKERDFKKNALAISSKQSQPIKSYQEIVKNFNRTIEFENLERCPDHWGGFSFVPFYFEFWEGHSARINKRNAYQLSKNDWTHTVLQP
jgi:pyridoxamine 5'-phosphate oxidase